MPDTNPFGAEPPTPPRRINPFGEEARTESPADAALRIEHAARKIRGLRSRLGSEGLTLSATREMIDELSEALDAVARALRSIAAR
ncbi:MAG TPA: hypothetical protein VF158_00510 [Longimicrobiales bacterium]